MPLGLLGLADVAAADELTDERTRYAVEHAVAVDERIVLPDVASSDRPVVSNADGCFDLADGHAASHGAMCERIHDSGRASPEGLTLAVSALDERNEHGPTIRLVCRHFVRLLNAPVRARLELVVQPLCVRRAAVNHLLGDGLHTGALVQQVDVLLVAVRVLGALVGVLGRADVVVQPLGEG